MINQTLKQLADNDGGHTHEKNLLLSYEDSKILKEIIHMTTDPSINFTVKKIPIYTPCVDGEIHDQKWALSEISLFATHKITGNKAFSHLTKILDNNFSVCETHFDEDLTFVKYTRNHTL